VLIVLASVLVASGAIGYGLRPGTDAPPPVLNSSVQIYVDGTTTVSVDETLYQRDARTVVVELDVFGRIGATGRATWRLGTDRTGSQPGSCPDLYRYAGQTHPNPFVIQDGGLTLGGMPVTDSALSGFTGRPETRAAGNIFELMGVSPGRPLPDELAPIAKVGLCWTSDRPLAFDGEYASATLPAVHVNSSGTAQPRFEVTRNLYFSDPLRQDTPLTAQYSLQAGALPTATDPFGWHWTADGGEAIQLTAISLRESQHEAYLGFVSGVLLGVAGNALVSLMQAAAEPFRPSPGGRRRSWWGGTAALIVTIAVVFATSYHPSRAAPPPISPVTTRSSDVRIVEDCYDPGLIEPTTIQLTCGDGSAVLSGLKWAAWGENSATGTGVLNQVVCDPSCSDGHDADHAVRVSLTEPTRAANGVRYFTKVRVEDGSTAPQDFQACWAEPPAPYLPTCPAYQ
jgi:hypothetical protein